MRNFFKILIIPFWVVFLCGGSALAYTIDDVYYGSDDHGHGDVIGNENMFGIDGADVSVTGTLLAFMGGN
jgi:hypothetical protein